MTPPQLFQMKRRVMPQRGIGMLDRVIDDVKLATGRAGRQIFFVIAAAVSLLVTTGFLCAAAFVFVLHRYGIVAACLTGAAIFFVATLLAAGSYAGLKATGKKRIKAESKPATASSFLPDPMVLATGLQVARAIGLKRVLPILVIGGVLLGVLAAKGFGSSDDEQDAEES